MIKRQFLSSIDMALVSFVGILLLMALPAHAQIFTQKDVTFYKVNEPMFAGSEVTLKVTCQGNSNIRWLIFFGLDPSAAETLRKYKLSSNDNTCCTEGNSCVNGFPDLDPTIYENHARVRGTIVCSKEGGQNSSDTNSFTIEGYYVTFVRSCNDVPMKEISIIYRGPHGLIDAREYPLLVFNGLLSLFHLFALLIWAFLTFRYYKDIFAFQWVIGGVIFLGMLETAIMYGYYSDYNSHGVRNDNLNLFAAVMESMKKSIARVLVLLVAMGYGVVVSHVPYLKRVITAGVIYFAVNTPYDIYEERNDSSAKDILAVPLAFLNAGFLGFVIYYLYNTLSSLTVKRQALKLAIYRKFAVFLSGCALFSVCFAAYDIWYSKNNGFYDKWDVYWLNLSLWDLQFYILLVFTAVLFRPAPNNLRYYYTAVDIDDPEEEELYNAGLPKESSGGEIKLRGLNREKSTDQSSSKSPAEAAEDENLRWVEENIIMGGTIGAILSEDNDNQTRDKVQ